MGIFRNRPTATADANYSDAAPGRHGVYGDAYVVPVADGWKNAADEGSYYVGTNAALGTPVAGHAAPALADNDDTPTKALLHIFNTGQRNIAMDYVKLQFETVNASSTSTGFTMFVDNMGQTGRTSAGTSVVPVNTNSGCSVATGAACYFGAVATSVTANLAKKIGQWTARPVIAVTEDQILFRFGQGAALNAHGVITGTTVASILVSVAPVVIAPGGNFYLCENYPSGAITAATYEFEFGFVER